MQPAIYGLFVTEFTWKNIAGNSQHWKMRVKADLVVNDPDKGWSAVSNGGDIKGRCFALYNYTVRVIMRNYSYILYNSYNIKLIDICFLTCWNTVFVDS